MPEGLLKLPFFSQEELRPEGAETFPPRDGGRGSAARAVLGAPQALCW